MVSHPSEFKYILIDESGVALIADTTLKVRELVAEHLFYGWGPTDLAQNHGSLSLKHVYAALAYYYEHQQKIDDQIKDDLRYVEESRQLAGASLIERKLHQQQAS